MTHSDSRGSPSSNHDNPITSRTLYGWHGNTNSDPRGTRRSLGEDKRSGGPAQDDTSIIPLALRGVQVKHGKQLPSSVPKRWRVKLARMNANGVYQGYVNSLLFHGSQHHAYACIPHSMV